MSRRKGRGRRVVLVPGAKHRAHEEQPAAYVALVQQHLRAMAGLAPSPSMEGAA